MENSKKPNLFLALLLSLLASLAGAIVFGLIYAVGYYVYLLAIAEIILACKVFNKFYPKKHWFPITFSIIWNLLLSFAFNVMSIVLCETFFLMKELNNATFAESLKLIIDSWKSVSEVTTYMNTRVIQVAAMIIIGGIVYGVYCLIHNKKNKQEPQPLPYKTQIQELKETVKNIEHQSQQASTPQSAIVNENVETENNSTKAINYYFIIEKIREALKVYFLDKDQEKLGLSMKKIKQEYVSQLSISEKQNVVLTAIEQQNNASLPKTEKKAIELLLKMIN